MQTTHYIDKVNPVKAMGDILDAFPYTLREFFTNKILKGVLPIKIPPSEYAGYRFTDVAITYIDIPEKDFTRIDNTCVIKDIEIELACHISGTLVNTIVRAQAVLSLSLEAVPPEITKLEVDITKFNYEVEKGILLNMVLGIGSLFLGTISSALSDILKDEANKFMHTHMPENTAGGQEETLVPEQIAGQNKTERIQVETLVSEQIAGQNKDNVEVTKKFKYTVEVDDNKDKGLVH